MGIVLQNNGEDREYDLIHAQRIFQFQERNPQIKDVWVIKKGEPYEYKPGKVKGEGELIGVSNKGKTQKPGGKDTTSDK
jgi:hypothetical protein